MKIVVLVKYVPDSETVWYFGENNTVDRSMGNLAELDEYALEAALVLQENNDLVEKEIIAVTMGPKQAAVALRRALQFGADRAYHVVDDNLVKADASVTAFVLAAVIKYIGAVDLVLLSMASSDGATALVPAQIAQNLCWPYLGAANKLAKVANKFLVEQENNGYNQTLEADFPAVISVTDVLNKPRYPGFKELVAAKKKPIQVIDLQDLNLDSGVEDLLVPFTEVKKIVPKVVKNRGEILVDSDETAAKFVDFLEKNNLL